MTRRISKVEVDTIKNNTKVSKVAKNKKIKEDEEPADNNAGLSDYEKLVQTNIAERMKLLEELGIEKDRDELRALTPSSKKNYRKSLGISGSGRGRGRPLGMKNGEGKPMKPAEATTHTMKTRGS